jgi:hypothetical protein
MSKKEAKFVGVIGGLATIVVAFTHAAVTGKWQKVHNDAAMVGAIATVVAAIA